MCYGMNIGATFLLQEPFAKAFGKKVTKYFSKSVHTVLERVFERVFKEYSKHISKEHSKDESNNLHIIFKIFKREREEVLRPKGKRERGTRGKLQDAPMPATFSNRTASHARTHARTKRNEFPVGGSAGSTHPPTLRYTYLFKKSHIENLP